MPIHYSRSDPILARDPILADPILAKEEERAAYG